MTKIKLIVKIFIFMLLIESLLSIYALENNDGDNEMSTDIGKGTTLIVISEPNPNELDALKQYVQDVMPMLLKLGGNVVKRNMITDTINGEQDFTFLLIMDFPSKNSFVGVGTPIT